MRKLPIAAGLKGRFPLVQIILGLILIITLVILIQSVFSAPRKSGPKILYRIPEPATSMAITGDLKYYDFIKSENALKFALLVKGGVSGREVKKGVTYEIAQTMSVWQIADTLLNKVYTGESYDCDRGCPEGNFNPGLLPGGDLAPTISQKYEWVKTYEDCVKSIGHDGGQLSSEQNTKRTGIRKCVSPDGREFTQGKDGWTNFVGG